MKHLKHVYLTKLFFLFSVTLFAQGWIGQSGTNSLSAVNSGLTVTPLNVGIGTLSPTAQLHTTGTLRFAGLTQNNSQNQLLVSDVSGNVFWRDAASLTPPNNSWLLNGNSGTSSPTNFLGTVDNQGLVFKTNNIQRLSVSANTVVNNRNVSYVDIGRAGVSSDMTCLNVWSRDIVGYSMPFFISSDVATLNWNYTPGSGNNTLGRLIRLNQGNTAANGGSDFYDIGIDEMKDFFITEHATPGTNAFPVKMLTIDSRNRVGINIGWGIRPTAVFHTNGTVRHENLPYGAGDPLVIDASGNIYRGYIQAKAPNVQQSNSEFEALKKEIDDLKKELDLLKNIISGKTVSAENSYTPKEAAIMNILPNPNSGISVINLKIPEKTNKAILIISNSEGKVIKEINIIASGTQVYKLNNDNLASGVYLCTLKIDGRIADTQKMVIAR